MTPTKTETRRKLGDQLRLGDEVLVAHEEFRPIVALWHDYSDRAPHGFYYVVEGSGIPTFLVNKETVFVKARDEPENAAAGPWEGIDLTKLTGRELAILDDALNDGMEAERKREPDESLTPEILANRIWLHEVLVSAINAEDYRRESKANPYYGL